MGRLLSGYVSLCLHPSKWGGFAQCLPAPVPHKKHKNQKLIKQMNRAMEAEKWNGSPTTCCSTNLCCSSTEHLDDCKDSTTDCGRPLEICYDSIPAMPCLERDQGHRPKDIPGLFQHLTAMVARPVSRKEMSANTKAMKAAQNEWNRLRNKTVWDETVVRNWSDVCAEARKKNK